MHNIHLLPPENLHFNQSNKILYEKGEVIQAAKK